MRTTTTTPHSTPPPQGGREQAEQGAASPYDTLAPSFDRLRALPEGVPQKVRAAVLAAIGSASPRVLDVGAGTGRIGWPFVAAGDDYVGIDLSVGMLHEFASRNRTARLAQADAARLPFGDASFDAVMLVHVFGGMRGWRGVLAEARRLLRPRGALMIGRVAAPANGLDARMKQRLAELLAERGRSVDSHNAREEVERSLDGIAGRRTLTVASWITERTPQHFIDRHRGGARFAALPESVKEGSLAALADWAIATFGRLDTAVYEQHAFELQIFTFPAQDTLHA